MPKDCQRCGGKGGGRSAPTFNATTETTDTITGLVKITQSVYLDSDQGTRRLFLGEEMRLQFSLIYQLLTQSCDVLYFVDKSDRQAFLIVYPDMQDCAR